MDITKFSKEELCEAYHTLKRGEWYDGFGEKPDRFEVMAERHIRFGKETVFYPAKEDYIRPLLEAIKNVVPTKELMRYYFVGKLGESDEKFETRHFLAEGGCFEGNPEVVWYFKKLLEQ